MAPDTAVEPGVETDAEVMASVEDGPTKRFVVADITSDDAYLTVPLEDAATLDAWR